MKDIDLIIFDLDGTLVDSREAIVEGVNFVLQKLGLEKKSLSEISSYIGTGVDDLIRKSLGNSHQDLFEQTKSLFENYRKKFPDSSPLYPGVKEVLEHFRNKRKIIITNRKYEFALQTLKEKGIYGYFEDILGGDDLGCMKPSSCSLDRTVNNLKMDRKKTIIVGDMDIDVKAGKGAKILTCAVTYGIGRKEDLLKAKPDFIINNILELKSIIK